MELISLMALWTVPFPLIPIHKFKKKKQNTITMTAIEYKRALNDAFNEGFEKGKLFSSGNKIKSKLEQTHGIGVKE